MRLDSTARRSAIERTLLEYHRSPGKYALSRRQPSMLYAAITDVLQIASGRAPEGASGMAPVQPVQQAACFFIRNALLYPDAGHYELLGVERGADGDALKERYRLMMRLMHPDFAGTLPANPWPADAATRVNRAYEVLSSAVQRRAYDQEAAPAAPPLREEPRGANSAGARLAAERAPAAKRRPGDPRRDLRRLSLVFGAAGGVAAAAVGIASLQSENRDSLVQRTATHSAMPSQDAQAAATPTQPKAPAAGTLQAMFNSPLPVLRLTLATEPMFEAARIARLAQPAPQSAAPALPRSFAPSLLPAPAPTFVAEGALTPAVLTTLPATAAKLDPPPPAPVARQVPYSGPTMADVHPMLARLLQEIESGWGDRMMNLVERDARIAPAGQALLAHYNALIEGVRPVQVSNVQFNAQPRESRLLVIGRLVVQAPERGLAPREFAVQAEFAQRDGAVVLTRLARGD